MGLIAAALGTAAGVVLALVLTKVVNPAFFGWTIHLYWPWWNLLVAPLWIVATAAGAAWYPAVRGARASIAESAVGVDEALAVGDFIGRAARFLVGMHMPKLAISRLSNRSIVCEEISRFDSASISLA